MDRNYANMTSQCASIQFCRICLGIQDWYASQFPDLKIVALVRSAKSCRRKIDRVEPAPTNSCGRKTLYKTTALTRMPLLQQIKIVSKLHQNCIKIAVVPRNPFFHLLTFFNRPLCMHTHEANIFVYLWKTMLYHAKCHPKRYKKRQNMYKKDSF